MWGGREEERRGKEEGRRGGKDEKGSEKSRRDWKREMLRVHCTSQ